MPGMATSQGTCRASARDAGLNSPPTILAAMADLGDMLVLVTGDSDYEGTSRHDCTQTENVSIVPKSPAMQSTIAALPSWKNDDICDDTFHHEWYYKARLEDPFTSEKRKGRGLNGLNGKAFPLVTR